MLLNSSSFVLFSRDLVLLARVLTTVSKSLHFDIEPFHIFTYTFQFVFCFNSPEPKAHGELIVCQSSCRLCVCKHFQT